MEERSKFPNLQNEKEKQERQKVKEERAEKLATSLVMIFLANTEAYLEERNRIAKGVRSGARSVQLIEGILNTQSIRHKHLFSNLPIRKLEKLSEELTDYLARPLDEGDSVPYCTWALFYIEGKIDALRESSEKQIKSELGGLTK